MTKYEFINWVKDGIGYSKRSRWTALSEYENLIRAFLKYRKPDFSIPSIVNYGYGINYIDNYLGKIWELNVTTSCNYTSNHNTAYSPQTSSSFHKTQSTTSSSYLIHDRSGVEKGYSHLIETLEGIVSDFKQLRLSKKDLDSIKLDLIKKLNAQLIEITNEKNFILHNTSWDKLVIGFFGETNAGKSTIIESLRILLRKNTSTGRDGEIVGDGRQDFTKDYHEYNLTIKNRPFVLIDVPGIEGNEKLFENRISEALRKAHIIFYVNGHNKPVDRGTAQKIKHYMSDGVKVTVLYNVRGNVEQYEFPEDRASFINPSIKTVLKNIDSTFSSLLGNKYNKSIPVQGLLSMCAYGDFSVSRRDLNKKQNSLLNFFQEDCRGNKEQARHLIKHFSNIDQIINLIEEKSYDFKEVIFNANMIKLKGFCKRVLTDFLDMINNSSSKFILYKQQVTSFKRDNNNEITSSVDLFSKTLNLRAEKLLEDFRKDVLANVRNQAYSAIDNRSAKLASEIEALAETVVHNQSLSLSDDVNARAQKLSSIPGFSTISMSTIRTNSFSFSFNTSAIKDEDSISFSDVATTTVNTGLGAGTGVAIGSIFGPIGMLVGGIIGGGASLVSSSINRGEEQTNRAIKKANELIDAKKSHIRRYVEQMTNNYRQTIEKEISNINQKADFQIQEIISFNDCAERAKNRLNSELKYIDANGINK